MCVGWSIDRIPFQPFVRLSFVHVIMSNRELPIDWSANNLWIKRLCALLSVSILFDCKIWILSAPGSAVLVLFPYICFPSVLLRTRLSRLSLSITNSNFKTWKKNRQRLYRFRPFSMKLMEFGFHYVAHDIFEWMQNLINAKERYYVSIILNNNEIEYYAFYDALWHSIYYTSMQSEFWFACRSAYF